ncbi:MAG: radical SAM family heme chaperone HemW [Proteobacteria bacterium]|nr:radical SAM family heme chaperone HemW [Pseudomonadota bacterium]MBU1612363.1 radical SAM family heme chaperone HemW [Pseudomonadota bacterium]
MNTPRVDVDALPLFQGKGEKAKGLLLYVHVPFCHSRCAYCSFHSQVFNDVTFSWYMKTLLLEIELWGRRLKRPSIATIYFGGGTPSLVPLNQLQRIMEAIHKHFRPMPRMEVTLEANPESTQDASWFRGLLSLGINRLSMGVQSLTDDDLKRLDRPHNARMAVEAFQQARQAGFTNISLDLIWGLPRQRLKQWLDQLKTISRLGPEHLSCYNLTIEEGTPLYRQSLEMDLELPYEQEQGKMFIYGAEELESLGYLQYEISNFARMGFESRHNQGYWEERDFLGLGPSAVTTIGNRRYRNPLFMDEYDAAVRGDFSSIGFEELDEQTRLTEMVMLALRTSKGLDLKEHRKRAGFDLVKTHEKLIKALIANDLARINRGRLRLTKPGMAVSNVIMERIALAEPPAPSSTPMSTPT